MQSRLAITAAARSCTSRYGLFLSQMAASGTTATGRTADPGVHSGNDGADPAVYPRDPEGMDDIANPKPAVEQSRAEFPRLSMEEEPPVSPTTPRAPTQKLENNPVGQAGEPNLQQKRKCSNGATQPHVSATCCAGLDEMAWPKDSREAETESDKEYYKQHKPSPLSEIEFADTRKPITQATDGTAASIEYGTGKDVKGWLPEQLDTAEEALKRGATIFKQNADPETFRHSRVLREMRGEWF